MNQNQSFEILKDYININSNKIFSTKEVAISYYLNEMLKIKYENNYLTYQYIADKAFVDKSLISRIISGERVPGKYVWFRIGKVGNYNLDYMTNFMNAAGYSFCDNNIVDVILRYAVLRKIEWDEIYCLFENFPSLFADKKLMKEIFGGYLDGLLTV